MRLPVAAFAAGLATCATAQPITATDPSGILEALQAMGYRASLTTDSDGAPLIESATAGATFHISFYGCTNGALCKSILFSAGFDIDGDISLARINEWNRDKLGGQAYLDDEGDPILNHFVTTTGGLSAENFEDNVLWWDTLQGEFMSHIGW